MNSKAKVEDRKCSGYLYYEAERATACMTLCLPHTLDKVRAGLRAWEVAGWACISAQSRSHVLSSISGARRAVDSVGLRSLMDLLTCWSEREVYAGEIGSLFVCLFGGDEA
jgi:hypothetical protein